MAKSLAVLVFFMLVKTAFGDEEYEFWEASKLGDVEAMKEILNSVPELDLDYHDDDGQTPLLLAVLGHHAKAVQFLTSRGADIEVKGRWPAPEDAPLAVAARLGDLDLLDVLLLGGANVGAASGPDGRTPLMVAAAAGKLDAVDMLLGVGAAVDATRGDGTTAACWAARGGHGDVLRLLLDNGANVNHVDVLDGSSLLHFAAQASTAEAVEIALEAGANAFARTHIMAPKGPPQGGEESGGDVRTPAHGVSVTEEGAVSGNGVYQPAREELKGGLTPAMSAAASAAIDALRILLDHTKEASPSNQAFLEQVDAVDVSGLTALAWAASVPLGRRSVECMQLLYLYGARDDSLTVDGRALVHVAADGKNAHALVFLIDVKQHPVDLVSFGKQHTPLIIASFHGSKACVKALLRRGANVNAAALDGGTPLIAAASSVQTFVAKLLLKKGANVLARLNSGEYPSQLTPKTPHGRLLKHSLSLAEHKAWRTLEYAQRLAGDPPPEPEEVLEDIEYSLLDDIEAGGDTGGEVAWSTEGLDPDEAFEYTAE